MSAQEQPIRLYVCHRFQADEDYARVPEYLDGARRFHYQLVSDPSLTVGGGREGQREAWRQQIQAAEIVVALSSHADQDPEGLEFQVRFAKSAGKPVLVMRRFGSVLPPPVTLARQAVQVVDWNERSLMDALKRHARGDSGARWDTIEFTLD